MKIAIVANTAWYLKNFRLNLALSLRQHGHEVVFISPADPYTADLEAHGFRHRAWSLSGSGTNPWQELTSLKHLRQLFREEQTKAIFSYTPKANIYSGLTAPKSVTLFVPNVSGLGRAFVQPNWITPIVKRLYRWAFRTAHRVVFQNEDDRLIFDRLGLAPLQSSVRVPGSGVDLQRFTPTPLPASGPDQATSFLFIGRLLADKGVREFVQAAQILKNEGRWVRCILLGSSKADNPSAVSLTELAAWTQRGLVEHIEHCDDVRPWIAQAHCVVLPSYREGVPRSLLEAGAMGRPLIASDAPGCRDAVQHEVNGYLCELRSASSLAQAMRRFMSLSAAEQTALGTASRQRMIEHFDEELVIQKYLAFASTDQDDA
jgi:glycosyltransferase involved in cell wall biosynthesis